MDEIILRAGNHAVADIEGDGADDAEVEAFEFRAGAGGFHGVQHFFDFCDRIIEQHGGPGPGAVILQFQIVQAAGVAGGDFRAQAGEARDGAGDVRPDGAGGLVDDDSRAGGADRGGDVRGDGGVPARHGAHARGLVTKMDVHDGCTLVERFAGGGGHLRGCHGDGVLGGVGEDAVEGAGEDGDTGWASGGETAWETGVCGRARADSGGDGMDAASAGAFGRSASGRRLVGTVPSMQI